MSGLGETLAGALQEVRARVGDAVAPVVVLTPADANTTLVRQQLALATPFIRVEFLSPEAWVRELGRGPLALRGLRPEPSSWLRTTVAAVVRELHGAKRLGRHGRVLAQPGWSGPVARAVEALETASVSADALASLDPAGHEDTQQVLVELLREVALRRRTERLYGLADLCDAASRAPSPWQGAVVLGDRLLAPRLHHTLRDWLDRTPHAEVRLGPWHQLESAPMGLRAATSGSVHEVPAPEPSALRAVATRLFGADGPASLSAEPLDDSVVLVRTPDDVREAHEAVRAVLDAVRGQVALDRIAIAVPDAAQVDVLQHQLTAAGVPATWLVGPPLATRPAAGFLLHALELAAGDDTVPAWYDLLRQPGLQLRRALGADVTDGRGRWARILARCGAVRDTATILAAIEAWAAAVDEEGRDPEGDRMAAARLQRAIRGLASAVSGARAAATLGEHAQRWRDLLRRFWVPSPDREQVLEVLTTWGSPGTGPVWSLRDAVVELRDALTRRPALEGRLGDPAIRVGTPMALFGGSFERVFVMGLTEGRLPRRHDEDPLLPDAFVDQIRVGLGASLLRSTDRAAFESRRFAALVSACRGRLWLSSAATEMLEERPLLPSSFTLDVASVLGGRRARYRDLTAAQRVEGSRARPWVRDPGRATCGLEHRIGGVVADRRAGLERLARHSIGRRLLGLHRALDTEGPSPWTDVAPIEAAHVPGMDGTPIRPWVLGRLVQDPGRFLVDQVLGVRRPYELAGASRVDARQQDRWLVTSVDTALTMGALDDGACMATWQAEVDHWRTFRRDVDDDVVADLRYDTAHRLGELRAGGLLPMGRREVVSGAPVPGLAWTLEGELQWVHGGIVRSLRSWRPTKLARDAPDVVLAALAVGGVTDIHLAGTDRKQTRGSVATEGAQVEGWLRVATEAISHGYWPLRQRGDVHLNAERTVDYTEDGHVDLIIERLAGEAP